MNKTRTTITVDAARLSAARKLTGATSASGTIDIALRRFIAAEQLRRDIEAYSRIPPSVEELMLGETPVTFDLDDDDVDYELLYPAEP